MGTNKTLCSIVLAALTFVSAAVGSASVSYAKAIPKDKLEKRISAMNKEEGQQKYAVFVSSNNLEREIDSVVGYQVLIANGFKKENIFVINKKENDKPEYPVDGIATKENLLKVIDYFAKTVDGDDLLFMYVTGKGTKDIVKYKDEGQEKQIELAFLELSDGIRISEREFARYLEKISPEKGLIFFEHDYSGRFAYAAGDGKFFAVSSTNENEQKFEKSLVAISFFMGLRDTSNDKNKDGKITVMEAYRFAMNHTQVLRDEKQHPLLIGWVNPNEFSIGTVENK